MLMIMFVFVWVGEFGSMGVGGGAGGGGVGGAGGAGGDGAAGGVDVVEGIESKTGGDEGLSWPAWYYPVVHNMFRRHQPTGARPKKTRRRNVVRGD